MIRKLFNKIIEIHSQTSITSAIVSLSAKIAVSKYEDLFLVKKGFFDLFKCSTKEKKNIEKIFDLASQKPTGIKNYAKRLHRHFKNNPAVLEELITAFLKISKANGILSDESLEKLKTVSKLFKLADKDFIRICNINQVYDLSNPYVILGVSPDISCKKLKLKYKELAKKYHPDSLVASGVPIEMRSLLEDKMSEINKAYEKIINKK